MDYAGDVEEVLGEIEQVIALGHPDAAAPVALRVTKRLRSLEADDSAGALEAANAPSTFYARACRRAAPSPPGSVVGWRLSGTGRPAGPR